MVNHSNGKKVFVGMSGGVDSSVSAALLLEQGYDVTGVYMKNWSGEEYGLQENCPWEEDLDYISKVCQKLGIEYKSYNFEKEYKQSVIEYFFAEYSKGRTPNPDVMCNREIKFKAFLDKALSEGADLIATGHYAQVQQIGNEFGMFKAVDDFKDQTYFLYTLGQKELSQTLLPIGGLNKPEVRKLAQRFGLATAERKDSQGICFIGKIDVGDFLRSNLKTKKGEIVDVDTENVVGEHDGVIFYTIGQREGLGIGGAEKPYYVCGKDSTKNILYVAKGGKNPALFKTEIELEDMHWIREGLRNNISECSVSVRYNQKPVEARMQELGKRIKIKFKEPVRAIAPGQSAVVYSGNECVGGGIIK